MNPIVEIFSQGEEVVSGQVADTNAAWLSQQLVQLGFQMKRHTAVGDDLEDLIAVLTEIAPRADCCICTGGLGPTIDDLTADAVAAAFNRPLQFDAIALSQIETFFVQRNRSMAVINRKQAFLPASAQRIDNPVGTAPGFALQHQRCWFVFLPGVPAEMQAMFLATVQADLQQRFELRPSRLVTLFCQGRGESDIQQALHDLQLPAEVRLGFRARVGEVQTKLLFPFGYPSEHLTAAVNEVIARIGANVVVAVEGIPFDSQAGTA